MKRGGGRRTSPRCVFVRPIHFEVTYDDAWGLDAMEHESVGIDISGGGLGMFTVYPLRKNEVLGLYFAPDAFKTAAPVFAKVAWTELVEKRFRAGLEFIA